MAERPKGVRQSLVTIRCTEYELEEVRRLVYCKKKPLAELFRAWVARELGRVDDDNRIKMHGPARAREIQAEMRAQARTKVVPIRPARRSGAR